MTFPKRRRKICSLHHKIRQEWRRKESDDKQRKDGTWNWGKILKAVDVYLIWYKKATTENERQQQAREKAMRILMRCGRGEVDAINQVTHDGRIKILFHINADQYAEVKKTLEDIGVTI